MKAGGRALTIIGSIRCLRLCSRQRAVPVCRGRRLRRRARRFLTRVGSYGTYRCRNLAPGSSLQGLGCRGRRDLAGPPFIQCAGLVILEKGKGGGGCRSTRTATDWARTGLRRPLLPRSPSAPELLDLASRGGSVCASESAVSTVPAADIDCWRDAPMVGGSGPRGGRGRAPRLHRPRGQSGTLHRASRPAGRLPGRSATRPSRPTVHRSAGGGSQYSSSGRRLQKRCSTTRPW